MGVNRGDADIPPYLVALPSRPRGGLRLVDRRQRHPDIHQFAQAVVQPQTRIARRRRRPQAGIAILDEGEYAFQRGEFPRLDLVEPIDIGPIHQSQRIQVRHQRIQALRQRDQPVAIVLLLGVDIEQIEGVEPTLARIVGQNIKAGGLAAIEMVGIEAMVDEKIHIAPLHRIQLLCPVDLREHMAVERKGRAHCGGVGQGRGVDPHLQRYRPQALAIDLYSHPPAIGAGRSPRRSPQRQPRHLIFSAAEHQLRSRQQRIGPPAGKVYGVFGRALREYIADLAPGNGSGRKSRPIGADQILYRQFERRAALGAKDQLYAFDFVARQFQSQRRTAAVADRLLAIQRLAQARQGIRYNLARGFRPPGHQAGPQRLGQHGKLPQISCAAALVPIEIDDANMGPVATRRAARPRPIELRRLLCMCIDQFPQIVADFHLVERRPPARATHLHRAAPKGIGQQFERRVDPCRDQAQIVQRQFVLTRRIAHK